MLGPCITGIVIAIDPPSSPLTLYCAEARRTHRTPRSPICPSAGGFFFPSLPFPCLLLRRALSAVVRYRRPVGWRQGGGSYGQNPPYSILHVQGSRRAEDAMGQQILFPGFSHTCNGVLTLVGGFAE